MFDIANTEIQTWKEYIKYQGMMWVQIWWDFGVINLYFGLFCSAGVLFNSSELGFDFLLLHNNAWQRNLKRRLLIPILHMFACLVSIQSKMWILQQTLCLHQRLVSLAWFRCYDGSYRVPEIFVYPLSEFEQHMYSSDLRPDTGSLMQLESRRAVPEASQPP